MASVVESVSPTNQPEAPDAHSPSNESDRILVATQWQLMWWRFRKHKLAMMAAVVLGLFYFVVIFADFLAYSDPLEDNAEILLLEPQPIQWFDGDEFRPHVFGFTGKRDPNTFKKVYTADPEIKLPLKLWADGYEHKFLGIFKTNKHLIGVEGGRAEEALFLIGTDGLGRDLFSRLMVSTRISMTIGLVGVAISLFLGILLGGLSGLYGGMVDAGIQRLIEIVRSVPTIPLWMALAAAVPPHWPITRQYCA